MNKYLIINPFGIGDVLFTTPVIKAIKDKEPDAFIGYWCNVRVAPLLKTNPNINKIFALSRGDLKKIYQDSKIKGAKLFLKLLAEIRKERFKICLDFSLDHRYSLTAKLLGIKKRLGFNYKKRGRFLTDRIDIEGYSAKHVVEYYLSLLRFLDIEVKNPRLELFASEQSKRQVSNLLKSFGVGPKDLVIGIAAGAGESWGRDAAFKHWPTLKFALLADRIIKELGAKVIILGSEQERPIADVIVNAMSNKAIDLAGKTDLEKFIASIGSLNLLVTNDGGPMHMAVAQGVKTVSIFGPVSDVVYGPYPAGKGHIVIKKDISCRPCYENFRFLGCSNNRACLEGITVDEVFIQVKNLI